MPSPDVRAFFDQASHTFSYVAWDPATRRAAVLDAVLDYEAASGRTGHAAADAVIAFVRAEGLTLDWVIDTHVHADHLSAASYVQARLGGKLAIGEHIREVQDTFGALFNAGDGATLYRSIRRFVALPEATRIFLCHAYKAPGRDEFAHQTTVAAERQGNIHVHDGIGEEEFVAMRRARDATLKVPQLLLPAVQVNMRAGRLPPAEDNGVRYLKIPLDAL